MAEIQRKLTQKFQRFGFLHPTGPAHFQQALQKITLFHMVRQYYDLSFTIGH
jgi:hypothetical protein